MVHPAEREKSEHRREQIVRAALALLAEAPLSELSTRRIAGAVGISQPALFRHFRSREAILVEVIATARADLGHVVTRIVSTPSAPHARLGALADALVGYVTENPGLPRLLFANVAAGDSPLLSALRQLHSMQLSLVAELVREGQRDGTFDPTVEPRDAATLFVGFLQALTSSRRLEERDEPLVEQGRRLFALWLKSVMAAHPSKPANVHAEVRREGLQSVDARPLLARGVDPLDSVLAAVQAVGPGGVVKLQVPFRPTPLLSLLGSRGHAVSAEQVNGKLWVVEIVHGGAPAPEDLRELEAPEPLERVLLACARLPRGRVYLARVPRVPRLLFPHLEERGLQYAVYEEQDGTALLRVFKP